MKKKSGQPLRIEVEGREVERGGVNGACGVRRFSGEKTPEIWQKKRKKADYAPVCLRKRSQPYCCFELDSAGIRPIRLERLHVGSLPPLGTLYDVKLHGLTFLQALETT
jgi:hypothetical protein